MRCPGAPWNCRPSQHLPGVRACSSRGHSAIPWMQPMRVSHLHARAALRMSKLRLAVPVSVLAPHACPASSCTVNSSCIAVGLGRLAGQRCAAEARHKSVLPSGCAPNEASCASSQSHGSTRGGCCTQQHVLECQRQSQQGRLQQPK